MTQKGSPSFLKCPGCKRFVDTDKYADHIAAGHSVETTEEAPEFLTGPKDNPKRETLVQAIDRMWHTPHILKPLFAWTLLMLFIGWLLGLARL